MARLRATLVFLLVLAGGRTLGSADLPLAGPAGTQTGLRCLPTVVMHLH